MKFLNNILTSLSLGTLNITKKNKLVDYKQEDLVKLGREQFKRLAEKGLGIPVVLL